jgi:hypothetical protein
MGLSRACGRVVTIPLAARRGIQPIIVLFGNVAGLPWSGNALRVQLGVGTGSAPEVQQAWNAAYAIASYLVLATSQGNATPESGVAIYYDSNAKQFGVTYPQLGGPTATGQETPANHWPY